MYIDIVNRNCVDPCRGQQPGILADQFHIAPKCVVVEKYGFSRVSTLDGAVKIIPVVDHADTLVRY